MIGQPKNERARAVGWSVDAAKRLAELVAAFGPKSSFAELLAVSRPSLNAILSGDSVPKVGTLMRAAELLGVSAEYILLGGTGAAGSAEQGSEPSMPRAKHPKPIRPDEPDLVDVVVSDVGYGLGGAYVDEQSAETTVEKFPRAFIRQFAKGPIEKLYFAVGNGDSMEPTVHSSDLILIDRSQTMLRVSDQVWAAAIGEICMVKRIRIRPGGEVLLVSDKEGVSDYAVAQDELQLIGRVVCVVKKL